MNIKSLFSCLLITGCLASSSQAEVLTCPTVEQIKSYPLQLDYSDPKSLNTYAIHSELIEINSHPWEIGLLSNGTVSLAEMNQKFQTIDTQYYLYAVKQENGNYRCYYSSSSDPYVIAKTTVYF